MCMNTTATIRDATGLRQLLLLDTTVLTTAAYKCQRLVTSVNMIAT
jgi:hypothetical protein